MLAPQILQSDDRMNPHQETSHNDYYRHEKMVRIVKMIGKKLQTKNPRSNGNLQLYFVAARHCRFHLWYFHCEFNAD